MRENRTSGSEGREAENSIRLPYPYRQAAPQIIDEPKKARAPRSSARDPGFVRGLSGLDQGAIQESGQPGTRIQSSPCIGGELPRIRNSRR